uniref:Pancreatic trypsin inhibitor n=1 Tax=Rhipicephalus zambeziensis TaxID=60191 RepID=A0A224Y233_9ACAR
MKLAASVLFLIFVNYIHGHIWSTGTKNEKGLKEPHKACWKQPFIGVCHPLKEAWYYDQRANSCKMLTPGTCAGGNNLFHTMKRCMKECMPLTPRNSEMCLQRPTIGSCGPVVVSWFFEAESKLCKMFNHTICGGGGNAFLTEKKCQSICRPKKTPKAVCSLTPKPGRCFLAKRKWHFNEKNNECEVFPNQRCGSNDNAFSTKKKCMERCSYVKAPSSCVNCEQTKGNELPLIKQPGQSGRNPK